MTKEQKELLLKDLCGRLPYRVKVHTPSKSICTIYSKPTIDSTIVIDGRGEEVCNISDIKPYLFPMSSMTEEQHKEYRKVCDLDMTILENRPMKGEPFPAMYNSQDWLDTHHFDYRGLIPMGLAKDATGLCIY